MIESLASTYLELGAVGFCLCLFGFMIVSLIRSQKEQTEDLELIKQRISKMESVIDNSQGIVLKLVDRINSSDKDREVFWRDLSDDMAFLKGRINGGGNRS